VAGLVAEQEVYGSRQGPSVQNSDALHFHQACHGGEQRVLLALLAAELSEAAAYSAVCFLFFMSIPL